MDLTQGEFCQFNLKSRISILKRKGILLASKKIDKIHEIRLFLIYGFYVEVFYNYFDKEVLKAEPVISNNWLNLYYG